MRKLPYIPDKDLYAAVMFACKMIRENGYFNKDCEIAADYYNVDVEDVKKYVRFAQGTGQRLANLKKSRKYHWYLGLWVPGFWSDLRTTDEVIKNTETLIVKATNDKNAFNSLKHKADYQCGFNGCYFVYAFFEFEKEKEAKEYQENISPEEIKKLLKEKYRDKFRKD